MTKRRPKDDGEHTMTRDEYYALREKTDHVHRVRHQNCGIPECGCDTAGNDPTTQVKGD